jgi:hypothetical protein
MGEEPTLELPCVEHSLVPACALNLQNLLVPLKVREAVEANVAAIGSEWQRHLVFVVGHGRSFQLLG